MKKLLCILLAAVLLAVPLLSGCAARSASGAVSESSEAASGEVSSEEPEETSSSEPAASSSEPEKTYPLPDMAGQDKMMIEDDVNFFLNYVGFDPIASTKELKPEDVLWACLVNLYRQKDMNAYFFESGGNGNEFIPADLVSDEAQRLFGLEGFSYADSDRYDAEKRAYVYNPGHDGNIQSKKIGTYKGTENGGLAMDISFGNVEPGADFDESSTAFVRRYTFNLLRLNGAPYLQLVSIEDVTPKK